MLQSRRGAPLLFAPLLQSMAIIDRYGYRAILYQAKVSNDSTEMLDDAYAADLRGQQHQQHHQHQHERLS